MRHSIQRSVPLQRGHGKFAFEKQDVIDLDGFTPHRLLYWVGMTSNSFEIRKFVAKYFLLKFPEDKFWKAILKEKFELPNNGT